jgi:hypothetical protein
MNITFAVPYDKQRQRTLLNFLIRPSATRLRIAGAVVAVIGGVMLLTDLTSVMWGTFIIILGVVTPTVSAKLTVSQTIRAQGALGRLGYQMTLDEAGVVVTSEMSEGRFAWSALDIVERPEAWYLHVSQMQGVAVFKDLMTEEQRAEFAAFVAQRQPV